MDLATDIQRIAEQEQRLQLSRMNLDVAWQLGVRLREIAASRSTPLTIEIRLAGETVFFSSMPGTAPANTDWARRKRNTVELMHRSSYGVGRSLERDGRTLQDTMGLAHRDYSSHGGSFPLRVRDVGVVGVVTVSGAPQREDHHIVVMALAELCEVRLAEIELD
ncbi:heme-degrading domain-containing protein [Piscinibacter sp. HJYY11]|uniref:heme-degrading domain-containing protein n=1 Tax=Piscinibacter sp. HJYY11 TaxID=2801333 RepID=UPI00191DCEC8|nr:heme-degrading domain-containing protein [Piscinibacter sp. HJYY11]MBL0727605.1 heme-degrading domain-containing protein [Piscinibacter sp. HJYY11]